MNDKFKNIIVILLLLFVYPLGLLLVFTWVKWPRWAKNIALIPVYLALLAILLSLALLVIRPNKALQQAEQKRSEQINYFGNTDEALDKQTKYNVSAIQSALEIYKVDHQKYPASLNDLVPKYYSDKKDPYSVSKFFYKVAQDGSYSIIATLSDGSTYSAISP